MFVWGGPVLWAQAETPHDPSSFFNRLGLARLESDGFKVTASDGAMFFFGFLLGNSGRDPFSSSTRNLRTLLPFCRLNYCLNLKPRMSKVA